MVMYEENARKINAMLAAINPAAQQDVIGLGHVDSMLKVNACLNAGTLVGMLADRTLNGDAMHPVALLGSPAKLPLGPFRMAAMLRRPVVFMTGLYLGGNRYAIHFETLADFSRVRAVSAKRPCSAAMVALRRIAGAILPARALQLVQFFRFLAATAKARTETTTDDNED